MRFWASLLISVVVAGCGGRPLWRAGHASSARSESAGSDEAEVGLPSRQDGFVAGRLDAEESEQIYAQASRTSVAQGATTPAPTEPDVPETATDAVDVSGPLVIYTGTVTLAVYEVEASQGRIAARARELGGFVSEQRGELIVVRIPAGHFQGFVDGLGADGTVLDRSLRAEEVGEEFRDLAIQIRNLEVFRQRLEGLLAQATNVEQALHVQRELERVTGDLERLRGRQRFLADRIAFSTLTIRFSALSREQLQRDPHVVLPFPWLNDLGLGTLLELR